jgi:hypothetical protein
MAEQKTPEERIGILEQGKKDSQKTYDEQFARLEARIGNVESWKDKILLLIVAILLTTLGNLAVGLVMLAMTKK